MPASRRQERVTSDPPPPGASSEPTAAARRGRATPPALVAGLAQLAAAVVAIALLQLALVLGGEAAVPRWISVLYPAVGLVYLAAGLAAWLRRPSNRLGPIMVAGAGVWMAAGFANTTVPALVAAGLIAMTLPLAIVVHLLHAFPSGRLHGAVSRATVLTGYAVCLVLQAPLYLFPAGPDSRLTLLRIAERADLAATGRDVQFVVGASVMAVTAWLVAGRLRRASPAQRRVLAPLFGYGILAVVIVPLVPRLPAVFPSGYAGEALQLGLLAGLPVAFAVGLLRGGFARTGELQELAAWLAADRHRPALADALADALGDPSLELLFATPGSGRHVDAQGRFAPLPAEGSGRAAVDVVLGEQRVGAIVYDATLIADAASVEAAGRVVALALRNEQLTAELRAGRDRLRRALARTVEASDVERRRIARDLHDGLQSRLVLLAIQADAVRADDALSAGGRATAAELGAGLQAAITELRDLVGGVMPAMLTERGLYAAAEELADRCPIPVTLDLDGTRAELPGAVESTAYFIVAEAIANAVKHSRATSVELSMARRNGTLRIELHDDGIGGAQAGAGAGMRGMTDRVAALDGRLVVRSPPGNGTGIVAELPCAS